jgi:hypothetical protein
LPDNTQTSQPADRANVRSIVIAGVLLFIMGYIAVLLIAWLPDWSLLSIEPIDLRAQYLFWTQISPGSIPGKETVLIDAGVQAPGLYRLLPAIGPFLVRHILDVKATWLLFVALGWIATFFSIRWLFRLDGFSSTTASLLTMIAIAFKELLSNLPPLSVNQADFVLRQITQTFSYRPLHMFYAGSEYLALPYFLFEVALSLKLLDSRFAMMTWAKRIALIGLWTLMTALWPVAYTYYWLHFVILLGVLMLVLLAMKRTTMKHLLQTLTIPVLIAAISWISITLNQGQFGRTEIGYDYLLRVGLQEGRFFYFVPGIVVRALLYPALTLLFMRSMLRRSLLLWIVTTIPLASILLGNIQIIIGQTAQPSHFAFLNDEAAMLWWILAGVYLWRRLNIADRAWWQHRAAAVTAAMVLIAVVFNGLWYLRTWNQIVDRSYIRSETRAVLAYLESHPDLRVILTDDTELQSNILFLLSRYDYVPWGAISVVDSDERMQRLHDAWSLLHPTDPEAAFGPWIAGRGAMIFLGKYDAGSEEYGSTIWRNPATRQMAIDFEEKGTIPALEMPAYENIDRSGTIRYRLDAIIYPAGAAVPACLTSDDILFEDTHFVIYAAPDFCAIAH